VGIARPLRTASLLDARRVVFDERPDGLAAARIVAWKPRAAPLAIRASLADAVQPVAAAATGEALVE